MKTPAYLLLIVLTFSVFFTSCERKFEGQSSVSFQFPEFPKLNSMTCTTCLKGLIIKIEGDDFKKIVFKKISDDLKSAGTEITGDFSFDVPTGVQRKFKVLGIYILNEQHVLAYAEKTIDIPDTKPVTVQLDMLNQGVLHEGSIVGRYITANSGGLDSGPTGLVDITLHYNNDPDFDVPILQSQIINGWFDFFASNTFPVTYTVHDQNITIFSRKTLNDLTPAAADLNRARFYRPDQFYRSTDGGTTWNLEKEKHDIIYGFFSPDSTLLTNKSVCIEYVSTPTAFSKMASDSSGTTYLTYSHNNTSASIHGIGGKNTTNHNADCPSTATMTGDRYTANTININRLQFDGNGNDTAKGFTSLFTYKYQTDYKKVTFSSGIYSLNLLPGVYTTSADTAMSFFDDLKVYKKSGATNGGIDDIKCTDQWLTAQGFSAVSTTNTLTSSNFSFSLNGGSSIFSTDGVVICPSKDGLLKEYGGVYLGALGYPNMSVSPTTLTLNTTTTSGYVTLYNTGSVTVTLSATITSGGGNINFLNGSYPGTSGTCGANLGPSSSCTLKIAYDALAADSATLTINYSGQTQTVSVIGSNP